MDKKIRKGLTFDDVLMVPSHSKVVPSEVVLETRLTKNISMPAPLISADMDTVTESAMAITLAKNGGIGIIHRNMSIDKQSDMIDEVKYTLNAYIENPICLMPDHTLRLLNSKMEEYGSRFSSFIITDRDGTLQGLITKDKTKFFDDDSIHLRDIMVDAFSIDRSVDVNEAYRIMKEQRISKLIITDPDKKVIGLYCWSDVSDIVKGINPIYNRDSKGQLRVGASIGVHDYERAEALLKKNVDVLLVGTAHGHSENVGETVRELKNNFGDYQFDVIAGNVATAEGAKYLADSGADAIKVGVGPGSICTTRIVAGVGVPQITAIMEAAESYGVPVIGDGGIRYSGDIVKAIVAGAETVMIGSMFGGTEESPGETIIYQGEKFKAYRGMGSEGAMKDHQGSRERYKQGEKFVPEGIEGMVSLKGTAEDIIFQLLGGLRSGMGYAGSRTIEELRQAEFIQITGAGLRESHPHDITITKEAPNYNRGDK